MTKSESNDLNSCYDALANAADGYSLGAISAACGLLNSAVLLQLPEQNRTLATMSFVVHTLQSMQIGRGEYDETLAALNTKIQDIATRLKAESRTIN